MLAGGTCASRQTGIPIIWVAGVQITQCSPCQDHSTISISGVIKAAASPPWCPAPAQCPGQGPSCRCRERPSAAARAPQTSSACRGGGWQCKQAGGLEEQARGCGVSACVFQSVRQQQCRVGDSACICAFMHARRPQHRQQLLQPPSHSDRPATVTSNVAPQVQQAKQARPFQMSAGRAGVPDLWLGYCQQPAACPLSCHPQNIQGPQCGE